jgi:polysaccharide biosynthesis/export protein
MFKRFLNLRCVPGFLVAVLVSGCGGNTIRPDERIQPMESAARPEGMAALAIGSANTIAVKDYRLGTGDELTITVFQVSELSGPREVNARGEISMPLLGTVPVAGKTALEIEDQLEALYGMELLVDPQITVDITEYVSQQVTLVGELRNPGMYPMQGQTTLLEVVALAGGVSRIADREGIIIFRTEDQQVFGYLVNLDEVMAGIKEDPEIKGSDRIVVPESGGAAFSRSLMIGVPGFGGYRQY